MSKDKKQEPTQGKELSEWQKRNQEYLQRKAEEEAKRPVVAICTASVITRGISAVSRT